jgi:hypothetical protein
MATPATCRIASGSRLLSIQPISKAMIEGFFLASANPVLSRGLRPAVPLPLRRSAGGSSRLTAAFAWFRKEALHWGNRADGRLERGSAGRRRDRGSAAVHAYGKPAGLDRVPRLHAS